MDIPLTIIIITGIDVIQQGMDTESLEFKRLRDDFNNLSMYCETLGFKFVGTCDRSGNSIGLLSHVFEEQIIFHSSGISRPPKDGSSDRDIYDFLERHEEECVAFYGAYIKFPKVEFPKTGPRARNSRIDGSW